MSSRLKAAAVAAPAKRGFSAPEGFRRLTMNLPQDLHRDLRLAAIAADCTVTDIVEALVKQHLNRLAEIQAINVLREAAKSKRVTS